MGTEGSRWHTGEMAQQLKSVCELQFLAPTLGSSQLPVTPAALRHEQES